MPAQESPRSWKRDHDEAFGLETPLYVPPHIVEQIRVQERSAETPSPTFPIPASTPNTRDPSPARSTTSSLSDVGSATPSYRQNSPMISTAFAALNDVAPLPAKKAKLTFAEKEARPLEKEFKDREKAEERAKKEQEHQQQQEKTKKDAERETDKRRREEEREAKRLANEAEKAAKEERKRRKEEEKRRKDEDKQRLEEEKKKKERSQKTLNSFFVIPTGPRKNSLTDGAPNSPTPPSNLSASAASPAHSTPSKQRTKDMPTYEKLFMEFFVKNNVTVAPINRFDRDEEAAESIQSTLDSYLLGNRSPGIPRTFDATSLFHLADNGVVRGKHCMPVREIMAEFSGKSCRPIDLTTDSQNTQIKRTKNLLSKVPLKYLKFQEDVRPPYRGTYTSRPVNGVEKMARNPLRRDLPNTSYDYDSEAEWIEDEDAEDLNSEGEEDEEGLEDGEDMDGFLDDENDDTSNSKRLVLQGDLEPISTGLCWEDRKMRNANVKLVPYRMEIILNPKLKSIDPFSSSYWEPLPVKTVGPMEPPRLPLNIMKATNSNINGPQSKPITMFGAGPYDGTQKPVAPAASTNSKPKKLIPESDMESFKKAVEGSDLSKLGLVEKLKKQFPGRPAASIKATLEMVALRVGAKEADKKWVLLETGSG